MKKEEIEYYMIRFQSLSENFVTLVRVIFLATFGSSSLFMQLISKVVGHSWVAKKRTVKLCKNLNKMLS